MSDFNRCPENSPFCLGITEFDCCGTQNLQLNMQLAHSTKTMSIVSHKTTMQPSVGMPLCQLVFLPVINNSGN